MVKRAPRGTGRSTGVVSAVALLVVLAGCGASDTTAAQQANTVSATSSSPADTSTAAPSVDRAWAGNAHVKSSPVEIDGKLVVGAQEGAEPLAIAAFETSSGRALWRTTVPVRDPKTSIDGPKELSEEPVLRLTARYTTEAPIVVVQYAVTVAPSGLTGATHAKWAAAFNTKSGALLWQHSVRGELVSSLGTPVLNVQTPVIFRHQDGNVNGSGFDSIDAATGKTIISSESTVPVIITGNVVLAEDKSELAKETLSARDATSGEVLWTRTRSYTFLSFMDARRGVAVIQEQETGQASVIFLVNAVTGYPIGPPRPGGTYPAASIDPTSNLYYLLGSGKSLSGFDLTTGAVAWTDPVEATIRPEQSIFAVGNGNLWVNARAFVQVDGATGKISEKEIYRYSIPNLFLPHQGIFVGDTLSSIPLD